MKKTIKFKANGMQCTSCEKTICKNVKKLKGIEFCNADYKTEDITVKYDTKHTSQEEIFSKIENEGYKCSDDNDLGFKIPGIKTILGWVLLIVGILVILSIFSYISTIFSGPVLTNNMSLGLLFILGLFTGLHCVSMCGGFVVSYTAKFAKEGKSSYLAHVQYGASKTISYTIIGAAFGFLGSIIAFTPAMRGFAAIVAGIFLIIFGLSMLNVFASLRRFRIAPPKFLYKFVSKKSSKYSKSPVVIGLLNGLMIACGPLQAIYIMAAATGSAATGALMLFVFGLGTLPVMMSFGYITSIISLSMTKKILKASGAIVIILGLIMFNTGLTLTGNSISFGFNKDFDNDVNLSIEEKKKRGIAILSDDGKYQEIYMDVTRFGWSPSKFYLLEGVPVKWHVNGVAVSSCNNAIEVNEYNLEFKINQGLQTINFTPDKSKTVPWSCWMGMIKGTFIVESDPTMFN